MFSQKFSLNQLTNFRHISHNLVFFANVTTKHFVLSMLLQTYCITSYSFKHIYSYYLCVLVSHNSVMSVWSNNLVHVMELFLMALLLLMCDIIISCLISCLLYAHPYTCLFLCACQSLIQSHCDQMTLCVRKSVRCIHLLKVCEVHTSLLQPQDKQNILEHHLILILNFVIQTFVTETTSLTQLHIVQTDCKYT